MRRLCIHSAPLQRRQVGEVGQCPMGDASGWALSPMGQAGPQANPLLSSTCVCPSDAQSEWEGSFPGTPSPPCSFQLCRSPAMAAPPGSLDRVPSRSCSLFLVLVASGHPCLQKHLAQNNLISVSGSLQPKVVPLTAPGHRNKSRWSQPGGPSLLVF